MTARRLIPLFIAACLLFASVRIMGDAWTIRYPCAPPHDGEFGRFNGERWARCEHAGNHWQWSGL